LQALFGKRLTEKGPAKGTSPAVDFTRCGGGWKRSDLAMVTVVKRPAGESRGKMAAGPTCQATPPRQPPTLL
jgi:hypothetical protein